MKKLFKNKTVRNLLHGVVGAVLGYLLSLTFGGVPLSIQIFLTIFVVGIIGIMWEWFWKMYNHSEIDYLDVVRAVVPALFFVNIWAGLLFLIILLLGYFDKKKL